MIRTNCTASREGCCVIDCDTAVIHALINGAPVLLPGGGSVLEALRTAGVHIPALCHDDRLAPSGACRTCLVHVKGSPKLAAA